MESKAEEFSPLPETLEVSVLSSGNTRKKQSVVRKKNLESSIGKKQDRPKGTSNEKNGSVILQSDEFLQRIKETNGQASRNILQK
ncbi:hypothetical protein R1flu_014296 [Riccia fluitans]|uniref:Uncharacterized protein n=1 Tax=Riccia fluitans TaxID=41844 RepID=A0ABD1YG17_9MARC